MSASHRRHAVFVIALAILGCGGRYGGAPVERPQPARGGIEAAALPYQIVDARTGKSVDEPAFWARLVAARAVCLGEEHDNPHHHWMQLHVVRELIRRLPPGTRLALAMEMFQRPFQGVLDDYAAHRIDAAQLRSRSGYEVRWGFDFAYYGPTIDAALGAGARLLAANASDELREKVRYHGLEALSPEDKAQLPELKLDDRAHRAWFDTLMEEMGGSAAHSQSSSRDAKDDDAHGSDEPAPRHGRSGGDEAPSADRVYTIQVLWDETMADTSARWLAANPGGHLILLAGNGHCHDSAVINRMKRRGVADAISVRGVIDDGQGSVGKALARPINDFLVVLQMPPGVQRASKSDDKDGDDKDQDDKPAK
ncbi:MAG TPA: ChaN family lipoprotein [Kofleriaceae bacterium]|jgi:uncharacterized iron-regulated protein|nr:ChaN family lipoprotein [Kofleriaceae bacterium]